MPRNAYIHIPFCKSKCHYCSFISFNKLHLKTDYLNSLEKEIKEKYQNEPLNTLYFGGGTPSNLNILEFENILKLFNISKNTEITVELNPETLTYDYLRNLYDLGINRVSIGIQTFDDKILKLINRRHNSQQGISAIKNAKKAGFSNISIDLIYGLPNQNSEMFLKDIAYGITLEIPHISFYGLSIEKGCHFYEHVPKNIPDEDSQADMYIEGVEFLKSNNYKHYEISNFAKDGFFSRHNLNYWNNNEYYGFGVAAHGYINNLRYGNTESLEEYIKNPFTIKEERYETLKDKLEEEIFLGFRKMSGINTKQINSKYNIDFDAKYNKILDKYENLKLLKKTKNGYALTTKGVLVSNIILADFL
jgi:oxygen-independent coproporphyrinogen-3 oxidase